LIKSLLKKNFLTIIFGLASVIGLYIISLGSYILYHSLVELFSIVIAFGIFTIAWNSKKYFDNNYILFVGIAYFFVALLDFFHILSYEGMGVFIGFQGSNLATQLWISSRYLLCISMFLAVFFIKRRLNYIIQLVSYSVAIVLILLSIFYWRIFPVCYIEGSGLTTFKIVSEYIISFISGAVILFLYFYRKELSRIVFKLIIASLVLTIMSELSFTLYIDVYGVLNQLGHAFELLSFFLIYKAIVETGFSQPFDLLFFKLKQTEKAIRESEEKFRSLYFSMNDGATLDEMIYDEAGNPVDYRILDANDVALSILGFKREQIVGKKASEIYNIDLTPYLGILSHVADSGEPTRFENYFPHLEKYFSISVYSPGKGKFANIFTDITERKNNEKEIAKLSRFPEENPNPIIRMDKKKSVVYTNESAKTFLGHFDDEKKNRFLKLIYDSISDWENNENIKIQTIETRLNKLTYEFTIVPVKGFDYFNIYGIDVTDRQKALRLRSIRNRDKTVNDERSKLARELHDTVTQTLFSSNLITEVVPKLWEKDPEAVIERLEQVRHLNNIALTEMRALLYELRPSALKYENLGNRLHGLVEAVLTRSAIPIELMIDGEYRFAPKVELGFYRIAQEALNNIIKHSQACKASLVLKILPEKILMDIADNGCGFEGKNIASTKLGLNIMRERAKLIGAVINIDSSPEKGTNISVIYDKKTKLKSGS
jgi:signal transduction histidine kinase